MFCTRCGRQIPDNAKFCTGCGASREGIRGTQPGRQASPAGFDGDSARGAAHGRRSRSRYLIFAAIAVVIVAGGATGGYFLARGHSSATSDAGSTTTVEGGLALTDGTSATAFDTTTMVLVTTTTAGPTTTATEATTTTTEATTTTAPPAGVSDDWPAGFDGWTVIIQSLPVGDPGSRSAAYDLAASMRSKGIDAGVLYSTSYSSLNPGYWAVFSGAFGSRSEALSHQTAVRSLGYGEAYARSITR
jgi:hypothetical protein